MNSLHHQQIQSLASKQKFSTLNFIFNKCLFVLLLVLFGAGCKKDIEESGLIAATFNEYMDPASLTATPFTTKLFYKPHLNIFFAEQF